MPVLQTSKNEVISIPCQQALASLYCTPSDEEWLYGSLTRSRSRDELMVQFMIVPLLRSVKSGSLAHPPQIRPNPKADKATQASSLRVGDPIYVYGSPFQQLQADVLRKSVRFGHVSCVIRKADHCKKRGGRVVVQSGKTIGRSVPKDNGGHNVIQGSEPPSLLLLDFKGLPGMSVFQPSVHKHSQGTIEFRRIQKTNR